MRAAIIEYLELEKQLRITGLKSMDLQHEIPKRLNAEILMFENMIKYLNVIGIVESEIKEEKEKILTAILYEHTDHKTMKITELDFEDIIADIIKAY